MEGRYAMLFHLAMMLPAVIGGKWTYCRCTGDTNEITCPTREGTAWAFVPMADQAAKSRLVSTERRYCSSGHICYANPARRYSWGEWASLCCNPSDASCKYYSGNKPKKGPLAGASCMSGNTGTFKASPVENSTGGFKRTVAIVKELAVGDKIEGLDADKQPALCTVEAVGMFGHGALYGNYTEDHFVLDPATGNVMQHGAVGKRTVEDKYEVLTSCPVGLDEAGTGFTPMDGDFCGKGTSEMGWSDYLLIHASMLRIVRATGGYWFSASAYSDFESVVKHGPELCAAMLACAGDGIECDELERISTLFVDNYLADDAREATLKWMPRSKGEVGAPGSVSFVVSQGKAPYRALVEPTKDTKRP